MKLMRSPSEFLCCAFLSFGIAISGFAGEWFADAAKPAGSGDGKSAATAFHTIQEAVNEAAANDTVWVAPGMYDDGETTGPSSGEIVQKCRVVIDKKINLFASGNRDNTFIVGSYAGLADPKDSPDAVQCIYITSAAAGTVIKGFTLKDGVLRNGLNQGGGAIRFSANTDAITPGLGYTVVLCRIDHCCSYSGGGMTAGWAIATLFTRNWCFGYRGAAVYKSNCYNCIFADNGEDAGCVSDGGAAALSNPGIAVNCTCVNNFKSFGLQQNSPTETMGRFYNVASVQNVNVCSDSTIWLDSCVIEGSYGAAKSTDVTVVPTSKAGWSQLMMAPILGDYRPVAGGYMDGKGNREYLELVPEAYRNMDFNGNDWDSTTAAVPVGAILQTATPIATPVYFDNAELTVNGRDFARSGGRMWLNADNCPLSVNLQTNAKLSAFHSLAITQYGSTTRQFIGKDGGFWLTLSEEYVGGVKQAESKVEFAKVDGPVYFVDEKNGNDGNVGTSAGAAFETLEKAASMLTGDGKNCIVYVAPGVYSNGVCTGGASGHPVRFKIPGACHLWLVGTGGKDVTIIEGADDPTAADKQGCGADAIGGVDCPGGSNVGICGFTFRNCRTTTDGSSNSGAAVYAGGMTVHVYDCDFHDNVSAGAGPAVNGAHVVRCRFWNNRSLANFGSVYGGIYSGCLFYGCPDSSVVAKCSLYNCTICSDGLSDTTRIFFETYGEVSAYGCLVTGGGKITATTGKTVGNVCWNLASVGWSGGFVSSDPRLAATWRNDFRPFAGSVAFTAGGFDASITEFGRYVTSDVDNNPLFPQGGEKPVGAVTTARTTLLDHYVNATTGNDANDGLTSATAKRTLTAAMDADDLCSGETVYAAAGTYADGSSYESGIGANDLSAAIPSRVVVRPGVMLKAIAEDPSKTVLRGGDGIRCAFVEGGARLEGFTLCDATLTNAIDRAELRVAGVYGRGYDRSIAENCIICDLYANHCPAASKICLKSCRILRANAITNTDRAIVDTCSLHSCLIDHCRGNPIIANYNEVINVTVGRDNYNYGNNSRTHMIQPPLGEGARIVNSLFLQDAASIAQNVGLVSNSVFATPIVLSDNATLVNVTKDVDYGTLVAQLDADLVPKSRDVELLVNAGVNDSVVGTRDAFGRQRIMNGAIDIGAGEFDYFPIYMADIGNPRRVTIVGTSSNTIDDGGKLRLPPDGWIEVMWDAGRSTEYGYVVGAAVTDGGVVGVYVNGERVGEIAANGTVTFESDLQVNAVKLVYEGNGSATVASFRRNCGFALIFR